MKNENMNITEHQNQNGKENAAIASEVTPEPQRAVATRNEETLADEWWAKLDAIEKDFLRCVGYMVAHTGITDEGQVVEASGGTRHNGKQRFLLASRMTGWGKNGRQLKKRRSEESVEKRWATTSPGGAPRALFGFTRESALRIVKRSGGQTAPKRQAK